MEVVVGRGDGDCGGGGGGIVERVEWTDEEGICGRWGFRGEEGTRPG